MAIFSSKKAEPTTPIAQLKSGKVTSPAEQSKLIREVLSDDGTKVKDVAWALGSPRPNLRRMAVELIKKQGGSDPSKLLIAQFSDRSEAEQKNVIQSITEFDGDVIQAIIDWLRSSDNRRNRSLLAYLIKQAPLTKIKEVLAELVNAGSGELRVTAIARLREEPAMLRSIGLGAEAIAAMWTATPTICARPATSWPPA